MHTNYVISLATATHRRAHIKQEFGRHNISFEFYDALSPSEHLNQLIQTHLPNLAHAKLSEGEKACFMSHYMLWQKCIDENLPYIYIFEDDVLLGEDAYQFLEEDDWLNERFTKNDAFILRFETFLNYSKCAEANIKPYCQRQILKLVVENCGTAGYVISNKEIIELVKFIKTLSAQALCSIDLIMFNRFNQDTYQLVPALCIQENQYYPNNSNLNSQLQKEREDIHNKKEKRTISSLLISLINKPKKIYNKLYKKLYISRHIVPFK
ncbi:glycosyltransferase family 25 protein [Rodentibacter heidelbergensis]|uniref:Lipooligosaccharide biosynthesis protein lic2B n=1 Tax=Rodentibacter heidelbergensis TaxID=1908258 RepID=A0A1V3I772_9PAST|nr:glycosyltransferase family 25 protein [Rodentibacter heidelbergensis]OOF35810.1 lipooligosaccharide biosynthesis protein lic2B [Rodentibacter heidelbergensis]